LKARRVNMHTGKRLLAGVAAIVVVLAAPGCVTKKLFRKNVAENESRFGGIETAVEENERRVSDLRQETDSKFTTIGGDVEKAVEVGTTALNTAEEASATAVRAERGRLLWTMMLSDDKVKFGFDEAQVSDEAKQELDKLAGMVKSMGKAVYLEIEGHTDSIGGEDYNYQLGQKRALAVLRYLNENAGIPLHAMNTISQGSSKPVADNQTREGRAQNRRVVIRVLE
jgi:outer membrane protein OmpA-like peptidoglycan-associated protein